MKYRQSCDRKVQVYYEGHKTLIKSHNWVEIYFINVKINWEISSNCVAFLENLNCTEGKKEM